MKLCEVTEDISAHFINCSLTQSEQLLISGEAAFVKRHDLRNKTDLFHVVKTALRARLLRVFCHLTTMKWESHGLSHYQNTNRSVVLLISGMRCWLAAERIFPASVSATAAERWATADCFECVDVQTGKVGETPTSKRPKYSRIFCSQGVKKIINKWLDETYTHFRKARRWMKIEGFWHEILHIISTRTHTNQSLDQKYAVIRGDSTYAEQWLSFMKPNQAFTRC